MGGKPATRDYRVVQTFSSLRLALFPFSETASLERTAALSIQIRHGATALTAAPAPEQSTKSKNQQYHKYARGAG